MFNVRIKRGSDKLTTQNNNSKKVVLLLVFLSLLLIMVFCLVISEIENFRKDIAQEANVFGKNYSSKDCVNKIEERVVRGNSLSGLIEAGQTVKLFYGYYNCHKIERGDVVLYNFAGGKEPIIKIVKGIEGDSFHLKKVDGSYHILINGEIIKNSQGKPYLIDQSGYKILSLYEKDYRGAIPKNSYLLLGNLTSGTLDSSRFGLVDKSDILGKAILI